MADESTENVEDLTPSRTLINSVRIYLGIAAVGWLVFEVLRRKMHKTYYCRDYTPEYKHSYLPIVMESRFFAWLHSLYMLNDDWMMMNCGMDALFHVRFLRMCQKIAFCGILLSGMLFPIYYTAINDDADSMYKLTMSHLQDDRGEWRFIFALLALVILSLWTFYLLWIENVEYVTRRHEFLSRQTPQQYSIVITGLPVHLRTPQTLRPYLENFFPGSVLHVYVTVECQHLEHLLSERIKVFNQLEHYLALSAQTGERMRIKSSMFSKDTNDQADAIDVYQNRLKHLNSAVTAEAHRLFQCQESLSNQFLEPGTESAIRSDKANEEPSTLEIRQSEEDGKNINFFKQLVHLPTHGMRISDIMHGCAFVTFNSLRATQTARQVLQSGDVTEMIIEEAPFVEEIVWKNVGVPSAQKMTFFIVSVAVTCGIIFFWTIPTSLVVSLANVDQLQKKWAWLRSTVSRNSWLAPVLEQVAPLVMSIMSSMAPFIFSVLSRREGHASESKVDASLFNKLVSYQIFVTFLLPLIVDSLVQSLTTFAKDFGALVNTLSSSIPVKSSYYITYVFIQMGLKMTLELLRVIPFVKGVIYDSFAPKLTARQRESAWFGLEPVYRPGEYENSSPLSEKFLVLILILVFASIAPIMCYVCFLFFFLSEMVYRWTVVCVCKPRLHSSAEFFPSLCRFCIGAVFLAQIIMAGLLALKKVALPATLALLAPIGTVVFNYVLNAKFKRVGTYLPLDHCTVVDSRRGRKMETLGRILENTYKQPALMQCNPIKPDYQLLGSDPGEDSV